MALRKRESRPSTRPLEPSALIPHPDMPSRGGQATPVPAGAGAGAFALLLRARRAYK